MSPYYRRLLFVLMVSLVSFVIATNVTAHTVELLRSEPATGSVLSTSPLEVSTWFNEEIQSGTSTLRVYDASSKQVDKGDGGVDLDDPDHASMKVGLPPLPDGGYLVRWHVVLIDGDASDGEFPFYIGETGAQAATAAASNGTPVAVGAVDGNKTPGPLILVGAISLVIVAGSYFILRKNKPQT